MSGEDILAARTRALAELDQANADLDAYDRWLAFMEPFMTEVPGRTVADAMHAMTADEVAECIRLGVIAGLFS